MKQHLANLLDLAVDIAANLGMGEDSRYSSVYSDLSLIRDTAMKLAGIPLEGPCDYPEDPFEDDVPF